MNTLLNICNNKVINNYNYYKKNLCILPLDLRYYINNIIFKNIQKIKKTIQKKSIDKYLFSLYLPWKTVKCFCEIGNRYDGITNNYQCYIINSSDLNNYDIFIKKYKPHILDKSYIITKIFQKKKYFYNLCIKINNHYLLDKTIKIEKEILI